MANDAKEIAEFVQRALKDIDVDFDEIEARVLTPRDGQERLLVEQFWNELMIFVHDFDIRRKDPEYSEKKGERLRCAVSSLELIGLLPRIKS